MSAGGMKAKKTSTRKRLASLVNDITIPICPN